MPKVEKEKKARTTAFATKPAAKTLFNPNAT